MGAMDKIVKVAKAAGRGARRGAKNISRVAKSSAEVGRFAAEAKAASPATDAGKIGNALFGLKSGGQNAARMIGGLGMKGKAEMGAVAGIPLLAALGLMSGGDDDEMQAMAEASGIPMGGGEEDPVQSMRAAMIPKVKRRIMNEIESGKRPEKVLERIQNNVYGQLADANSQIAQETEGQYQADDLYKFSSALEQVLASQDTPTKKLAQLYALSGE